MLHEIIPVTGVKQSQLAYSRNYGAEASKNYRRVFDFFVSKFSESGPVFPNQKHSWIGFTVPLEKVPHLVLGERWDSHWTLERQHSDFRLVLPDKLLPQSVENSKRGAAGEHPRASRKYRSAKKIAQG
jgi:hypothetical protein